MDFNRLLTQLVNMFLRQIMNRGIKTGIDYASRRGKPAAQMTPEERQKARQSRTLAEQARRAAQMLRRFGR
ncbi:hypothetical protein [Pseudogemmobacter blasticus]|uniref:Uncharacterized protein n=1 Tax=Fuscovulum blasticum DSM 2131 TaxID=1188250 RepID=A0A2T4JB25_FUSBL|nr:hypothetical protein [Fuscovulum blasticum]AWD20451.1 hypothetical protein B6K69_01265 [Fuscovulum blasticum]PTE15102.1 hypothetical protein C5F44_07460 [Fuscovulum blasticum DSM 2131]